MYPADLQMLNIPVVSMKGQQEIVDYITNLRSKATALRQEGRDILESAKRNVERMIISE